MLKKLEAAFIIFVAGLCPASANEVATKIEKEWKSPNGHLVAHTKNFKHPGEEDYADWDVVTIRDLNYKILASISLENGSGISRAVVTEALWSSDSRFFIFQTTSSGGHSAWHFPLYVYDATTSLTYSVDDTLGAITSSAEGLKCTKDDVLKIDLFNSNFDKNTDAFSFPKTISLTDFVKNGAKIAIHSIKYKH